MKSFQLEDGSRKSEEMRFKKAIGGLLYLTHTRPDLVFAISLVSRYLHNPSKHHMGVMKRILHYAARTIDFGLPYHHVDEFKLVDHVDNDCDGSLDDRKSTSGWVFSLGLGAITWSLKKQEIMTLLSTKAEYVSVTSEAGQGAWIRRLLEDLGVH
ncbi:secreted RxLR effector protein 161-like [Dioscorea cayenensis subsp. rotundata]|uniref:Secreted RxLR effector protein 161-like n=1 Tax=Dioscorea cayennensis subsp. rotundata TaxID=55577 RepID=A0AB40CNT7_DIOCR|nr:secreted RxLR effector protein 161-like [Dioscorea cayenensis subsp. rotundata]